MLEAAENPLNGHTQLVKAFPSIREPGQRPQHPQVGIRGFPLLAVAVNHRLSAFRLEPATVDLVLLATRRSGLLTPIPL